MECSRLLRKKRQRQSVSFSSICHTLATPPFCLFARARAFLVDAGTPFETRAAGESELLYSLCTMPPSRSGSPGKPSVSIAPEGGGDAEAPKTPSKRTLQSAIKVTASASKLNLTTKEKKRELKSALSKMLMGYAKNFWRYDTDGSGEIDREEFGESLRGLKLPYAHDDEVVDLLFNEMDFDGSGEISQAEVIRYALLDIMSKSRDRIKNLCKLWDYDCSNTINRDEFGRIMEALGLEVPVVAVDALFKDLDEDRTGELVYEEFTRKLRGAEGAAARTLAEAQPAPTKMELLRQAGKRMSMLNTTTKKIWPDFPPPEPLYDPLPILPSSSHPPSDEESDPESTPRTALAEGKDLAQYIRSTRLEEAHEQLTQ